MNLGDLIFTPIEPNDPRVSMSVPARAFEQGIADDVFVTEIDATLEELGVFYAEAAGNRHRSLRMDTYIIHDYDGELTASSEVEELRWINTQTTGLEVGSIIEHDVMPLLKQRNLID